MSFQEEGKNGLSDRLSGHVLNGLTQSDSGPQEWNRFRLDSSIETYHLSEAQRSAILRDYGDSPLQQLSGHTHNIMALIVHQCFQISWFRSLWFKIFPRRFLIDHQFKSAVFRISFDLGNILQLLLTGHISDDFFTSIARHIISLESVVLSFSGEFEKILYDVIFQRLVMHIYAVSHEERFVDLFLAMYLILSNEKNVLRVIQSVQALSYGDPRPAGLGFELLRGISVSIARIVLSRLHSLPIEDLKVLTSFPSSSFVTLGDGVRVNVLEAIVNELYGRLDYSGWFLHSYEAKKEKVIELFYGLSHSLTLPEGSFCISYQNLVSFFDQLKEELGCALIGALDVLIKRLQAKLLESITDVLSERQVIELLRVCSYDMLLWFLKTSAEGSLFYARVKAIIDADSLS